MSNFPSHPAPLSLLEVFRWFPATARPLIAYHEALMRGPSELSASERELIAAYVSGLNACGYCHGVHAATAEAFGMPPATLVAMLADLDTAPVDARLRPILAFAGRLTREPSRIRPQDVEAVYAAGWSEAALHDAVSVCALFNMMNRLVDGLGISAEAGYLAMSGVRLHDGGYAGLLPLLGPERPAGS